MRTRGIELEVEVDRLTVVADEMVSSDGYRLLWYHSTKKAEHDARYRARSLQRASRELTDLRERLSGPRTRFKSRKKVDEAVQEILKTLKDVANPAMVRRVPSRGGGNVGTPRAELASPSDTYLFCVQRPSRIQC